MCTTDSTLNVGKPILYSKRFCNLVMNFSKCGQTLKIVQDMEKLTTASAPFHFPQGPGELSD